MIVETVQVGQPGPVEFLRPWMGAGRVRNDDQRAGLGRGAGGALRRQAQAKNQREVFEGQGPGDHRRSVIDWPEGAKGNTRPRAASSPV